MICKVCGKDNAEGMKFCTGCGTPVTDVVNPAPAEPVFQAPVAEPQFQSAPFQPAPVQPTPVQPVQAPYTPVSPMAQVPPVKEKKPVNIDLSVILAGVSVIGSGFVVSIFNSILNALVNEIFGYSEFGWCLISIICTVIRLAVAVGLSIPACKELKDRIVFVSVGYAGGEIGVIANYFLNAVIALFNGYTSSGGAVFISSALSGIVGSLLAAGIFYVYKNGLNLKK